MSDTAQSNLRVDLSGQVALVTGGSSGIGKATSLLFARCGAKVVIGDVNPAGVEIAETIKQERGEAIFIETDVSVAEQMKNLVTATVKTFGGLHCAFNNAGVLPPTVMLSEIEPTFISKLISSAS